MLLLLLYYLPRNCSGLEGLTGDHCLTLKHLIPTGDRFALSIRDYIRKDTQRGPGSSLVLPARMLQLVRRNYDSTGNIVVNYRSYPA